MKITLMGRYLMGAVVLAFLFSAGTLSATTVALVGGHGSAGHVDGDTYIQAYFNTPVGMTEDSAGDLWVADSGNNAIRVISNPTASQGGGSETLTFAPVVTNLIVHPIAVSLDNVGDVFILDYGNGKNGNVLEYDTQYGDIEATNAVNLTNAAAMAMDTSGNLYVTVNTNQIVEIAQPGFSNIITTVVTITNAGTSLKGLVVKRTGTYAGWIAVCDAGRNGIYLVNPGTQTVITNAGFHGAGDFPNGTDTSSSKDAKFNQPMGVAETGDGSLIVTDYGNNRVKVVKASDGGVTNLYGVVTGDWTNGPYPGFSSILNPSTGAPEVVKVPDTFGGVAARQPDGIIFDSSGVVYVTEEYYNIIRDATGSGLPLPPPLAPLPPTGLVAITNASGVQLTWGASTGATNYTIYRANDSSSGSYLIIGNTSSTTFEDTDPEVGATNFYEVSASNTGGTSANSLPVSILVVPPPPPPPQIGWYDFEGNTLTGFFSVLHPVSGAIPYQAANPISIAIYSTVTNGGVGTRYITIPPASLTNNPTAQSGANAPVYENNQAFPGGGNVNPLPTLTLSNGTVTIKAINYESFNGGYLTSSVTSAIFLFQVDTPTPVGNNAAQFQLNDVSTNVIFYYTTDGSDPSNAPASQQIFTTNGIATLSLNGTTNFLFQVRAFGYGADANFLPSGIFSQEFTTNTFVPNTISFGFASGEGSSGFVASPGQTFYAPITLTTLPGQLMDQLQFNLTVTNAGPNPGPPITPGAFDFQSMLMQPVPSEPGVYELIPPYMFVDDSNPSITNQQVTYHGSTNFDDLVFTNLSENLLAVGWEERQGNTNLYNTKSQDLIQFSLAHDDLFPNTQQGEPNGVIVGGYSFEVPVTATEGQTYQIKIGAPSATTDGIGEPGSSIFVYNPTNNSLGVGGLNALKNVTIGQKRYIVGDVAPFNWFNAGDFGDSTINAPDVAQIFEAAIYGLNMPPFDPTSGNGAGGFTNVSDFYDGMDSCGATYVDLGHGYLEKDTTVSSPGALNALFGGNDQSINQIAFGDGVLDVCDVYVTYRRSLDSGLVWFQRFWTNGVRVAVIVTNTINSGVVTKSSGGKVLAAVGGSSSPISITNTPTVNFTTPDYVATAGQTLTIPINATVFGAYPLRVAMISVSVDPLDGSPALTTPVSFTSAALGSPTFTTNGTATYGAAWLNSTITGIPNKGSIGTLTVTIPSNANAMSSYAIHFDHASGSPNGIASFTRHALTGLITLSSRTNSYYNDGIPDSWRLRYFGTIYNYLSASNADASGSGMENWQKYQAGLDPTDPASTLSVSTDQVMAQGAQDSVIAWPTVNNQTYVIQRSASLFPANWISVSTNTGDGTYMEIHDSPTNWMKFYRVVTP
ncbi:MAG TPA: NHL repeat-containing protein [Verrucomicrobiae bacterium]|jgi:hypothetical protein